VQTVLYFDCFSGASGDMVLGALLDAGLPLDALRQALGSLALEHYRVDAKKVVRAGVSATQFVLEETGPASGTEEAEPIHAHAHSHLHSHGHAHRHDQLQRGDELQDLGSAPDRPIPAPRGPTHNAGSDPGVHAHRTLAEIEALIARSALSASGRTRAAALVRRLAEAEAAIHAVPLERVHLHEVGALDSIVDIVGGVFAIEWFGASRIAASAMNVGSGVVDCAHGRFPVPAPATARLLQGVPIYQAGPAMELTTPTGALLVTGFAERFGPMPEMVVDRIGYGAGSRDLPGHPNVLRVLVGRAVESQGSRDRVTLMEFAIDDMNPQLYGALMDGLLAAGALDVYYTSVQMKKSRPGTLVTVVSSPERRDRLASLVFRETTTLGLRYHDVLRECLEREERHVTTPWGLVRLKLARLGDEVVNASPEYDDCLRLAREHSVPVKDVHAAAMKAWLDSRS
jgi:pyridinium-3,5-bisthiocarboxylic acid mononucleotide nickel chelatase